MNKLTVLRHADVIAGVLVFLLVGRFGPPEWGILAIAAGVVAYSSSTASIRPPGSKGGISS